MIASVKFVSRRDLVCRYAPAVLSCQVAARLGIAQNAKIVETKPGTLADHPGGKYSFIRGIPAYSAGVIARNGHEIVHATFSRPRALSAGFKAIDEHLTAANLSKDALCALELRSPHALSSDEFKTFNSLYTGLLRSWNILLERGVNPIARTNVSPVLFPPSEPSIHGFSYVTRSNASERTFVVAGGGELPDGSTNAADILRRGDNSAAALLEKAQFVMSRMNARLGAMGVGWSDVTVIEAYTAHEFSESLIRELLHQTGHNTVTWNYARPPIEDLEFEMDLRGVRREVVL